MRRVVTGRRDGKAVVVSDTEVEAIGSGLMPGTVFHQIWGSDEPATAPTNGVMPKHHGYFPPAGGYRFVFFTLGPESVTPAEDIDIGAAISELQRKLPGLAEVMEPDHPGMHTTDTVDLDLVISGEIWLELDDGKEVHLRAGDCVIQNGTRHAWHNRTSEPTVMFGALIGAQPRSDRKD